MSKPSSLGHWRSLRAGLAIGLFITTGACTARARRATSGPGPGGTDQPREPEARTVEVAPLPGWPRWVGRENHQISGLAFRDGRLYAVSDQSGVWTRALLEIGPLPRGDAEGAAAPDATPDHASTASSPERDPGASDDRSVGVQVRCRWQGGPHPDAEGMALEPMHGPPRTALLTLETNADALVEIGFDDCAVRAQVPHLTGSASNEGIEGLALSPDGKTVYLVHETECTLLSMPRAGPGPARRIARIAGAHSLCDAAYDDRGTEPADDDRLLLLDRNARQIFDVTTSGRVVGRWRFDRDALARDPDGYPYALVALEALAIESREPDGSLLVYAATDTPPRPLPYSRRGKDDDAGLYARRVGMLYRFRLPPL